jgi:hypothetical protein
MGSSHIHEGFQLHPPMTDKGSKLHGRVEATAASFLRELVSSCLS